MDLDRFVRAAVREQLHALGRDQDFAALESWYQNEGQHLLAREGPDAFRAAGAAFLTNLGWADEQITTLQTFHEEGSVLGPQAVAEVGASLLGDPAARESEIAADRKLLREDPNAYWSRENIYERDRLNDLLALDERRADGSATNGAPGHAASPSVAPAGPGTARITEIEHMMKTDYQGYWGNPAVQQEYASLLEAREAASGPSDSGPSAPPSTTEI
jgi:hypothetical protein